MSSRIDHTTPRNRSGKKESKTRDLDHVMGSRFFERTGIKNKCITHAEFEQWKKEKYGK